MRAKDEILIKHYHEFIKDARRVQKNLTHKYINIRLEWHINSCISWFTDYELTMYDLKAGRRLEKGVVDLAVLLSEIEMAFKKSVDRYTEPDASYTASDMLDSLQRASEVYTK